MSALSHDQRFVLVLLIATASGAWLIAGTTAQTFTAEDRNAIQKFMDVLLNFLDAEAEPSNATTTESPNNATTTDPLESTTLASNSTSPDDESTTASNSTSTDSEPTSESTTPATNATSESTTAISSTTQVSAAPRRMCFKRVCYKFVGDRGYIF
ncbi:PREDICTED: cell wall integrity and stress response component 2 [Drosophila arizonae]|uniref:Cell wall integrity and stress response component 2 n=1 Tax=Drosophila arizonae TaxID=7263 RepID=A0ABM1PSP8_DROAR|nr:PREDICTED: cell wall integrity and stress response component 2 [Drosophila arizonae]